MLMINVVMIVLVMMMIVMMMVVMMITIDGDGNDDNDDGMQSQWSKYVLRGWDTEWVKNDKITYKGCAKTPCHP